MITVATIKQYFGASNVDAWYRSIVDTETIDEQGQVYIDLAEAQAADLLRNGVADLDTLAASVPVIHAVSCIAAYHWYCATGIATPHMLEMTKMHDRARKTLMNYANERVISDDVYTVVATPNVIEDEDDA